MLNVGEDELTCDLAETYHVLNWRELPLSLAATLSVGLRDDSRIKKKISGVKLSLSEMLGALTTDILNLILWTKTKDGQKNRNKPKSLFKKLMDLDKEKKDELMSFSTPEEFEEWRSRKMKASRENV